MYAEQVCLDTEKDTRLHNEVTSVYKEDDNSRQCSSSDTSHTAINV